MSAWQRLVAAWRNRLLGIKPKVSHGPIVLTAFVSPKPLQLPASSMLRMRLPHARRHPPQSSLETYGIESPDFVPLI